MAPDGLAPLPAARRWRVAVAGAAVVWTLWAIGQLVRDLTWLTGLLFYIPSVVVAILLLAVGAWAWRCRRRQTACHLAGLALAPLLVVGCLDNRFWPRESSASPPAALRMIHWNVSSGRFGWSALEQELLPHEADVYVLSEITGDLLREAKDAGLPEGYVVHRIGNIAIIARGALENGSWLHRRHGLKAYGVTWHSPNGSYRLLIVDLDSNPWRPRNPRLAIVRELLVEWRPDLVMGDFNAPRHSYQLKPLPAGFRHAYDEAGVGWSYTWPAPLPLYAIDQTILGPRLHALRYDLETTWASDHRLQVLDFVSRE